MACTVADFHKRFPEFCETDDDRVQLFVSDATLLMGDEARWHGFYDVAQCYLVAHLLVVAEATESGDINALAPVKKQEVDDVIVEFAVDKAKVSIDDLYSTSYGKQYIRYRQIAFVGPIGV